MARNLDNSDNRTDYLCNLDSAPTMDRIEMLEEIYRMLGELSPEQVRTIMEMVL